MRKKSHHVVRKQKIASLTVIRILNDESISMRIKMFNSMNFFTRSSTKRIRKPPIRTNILTISYIPVIKRVALGHARVSADDFLGDNGQYKTLSTCLLTCPVYVMKLRRNILTCLLAIFFINWICHGKSFLVNEKKASRVLQQ